MRVTVEQLQQANKGANQSDYIEGSANWWEVFAVHLNHSLREGVSPLRELSDKATSGEWWGHAQGPKYVELPLADYFFARACVNYVRGKL